MYSLSKANLIMDMAELEVFFFKLIYPNPISVIIIVHAHVTVKSDADLIYSLA